MKIKSAVLFSILVLLSLPLKAAERFEAGTNYLELPEPRTLVNPDDGRLEITLFFWYGCGACALADPAFTKWAKNQPPDLLTGKLPTTYREPWNTHARVFMALDEMGVEKELHNRIFKAFESPEGMVRSEDDLADFAKSMGLDAEAFMGAYKSKATQERMNRLEKLMETYDIQAVPAIVVDGRYISDLGRVESTAEFMELAGELLEKARAERGR